MDKNQKEIQKMLDSIDLENFWKRVTKKISEDADRYAYAKAKSKEQGHRVFI
jgi:hypothetical protein